MNTKKNWSGRFQKATAKIVEDFTASIPFDWKLYEEDIQGSVAHATMLGQTGIISRDEASILVEGLSKVLDKFKSSSVTWSTADEDIHMLNERLLREEVGEIAGKLHTARSRNDQVATDLHLYTRTQVLSIASLLVDLCKALHRQASDHTTTLMPGYTHLQRAQPIVFGHHLLAYVAMFHRDLLRLKDQFPRVNQLPLGAGALAGTTFPIDREFVADFLACDGVYENSVDAVSDRDFIAEFLFTCSLIMTHLSRLSEEIILWSSAEFKFIELDDGYCTGSSIMPQKKNPDVAELIRGKTGRCYGGLIGLLTVLKGLPLAYNKDMQEDKESLFDVVSTVSTSCHLMAEMISTWKINVLIMEKATLDGFLNATEIADYLANKGMPFREAHEVSGKAVRLCIESGCTLENISIVDYKLLSNLIESDIFPFLEMRQVVNRRTSQGGTSPLQVEKQLVDFLARVEALELWIDETITRCSLAGLKS